MALRRFKKALTQARHVPPRPPPKPAVSPAKESEKARENVFSDDEVEKKFIDDVTSGGQAFWNPGPIGWNTIHGIPWKRKMKLGAGSFGAVFVGRRESDKKLFAVKSINIGLEGEISRNTIKRIDLQLQEIKMMRRLKYNYIVRCLGCGRSKDENGLFQLPSLDVFLEYAIRGSLSHNRKLRGRPFEEDPYVRQYTHDLLKALQYMEKKGVVHGDIKMANLLLGENCVKLADWGGAKQLDKSNWKRMLIGTPGFRSPEVQQSLFQDHSSDVFSLGCTVIEMLTSAPPATVATLVSGSFYGRRMKVRAIRPTIPTKFSPVCQDFLKHCLCVDSKQRWTADELLHHPFIADRDLSGLPYDMAMPQHIDVDANLLHHPGAPDPELPDGPMSSRVEAYLKKDWLRDIIEMSSGELVSNPSGFQPPPLAPLQPDVVIDPNAPLSDGILNDIVFVGRPSGPDAAASPGRELLNSPNRARLEDSIELVGDPNEKVDMEFVDEYERIRLRQERRQGTYPRALNAMRTYAGRLNETFAEMKEMNESVIAAFNPSSKRRAKNSQRSALATILGCGRGAAVDAVAPTD